MKKIILSITTVFAAAAILVAQDSATAPAGKSPESEPATVKSSAPADDGKKYNIAMKYQPEKKYEIIITREQNYECISDADRTYRTHSTSNITCYLDVAAAQKDGSVLAKLRIHRIVITSKRDGNDEEVFDTDKAEKAESENPSFREMTAATEQEYTVYFDTDGKVEKIDGLDEYINKIAGNNTNEAKIARKKKIFEYSLSSLISTPIIYNCQFDKVGDSCDFSRTLQLPYERESGKTASEEALTMKLASIKDSQTGKIAIVNFEGTAAGSGGDNIAGCKGQLKFNLDKKMVEYVMMETSNKPVDTKVETKVKLVDKIPDRAAASQPADSGSAK